MQRLILLGVFMLSACGDSGPATNPGTGSQTLFVRAAVIYENGGANFFVSILRDGVDVSAATVTMTGTGTADLMPTTLGNYTGGQAGWAGSYRLKVVDGDDWLDGEILSPDPADLTTPDPTRAFDAQNATNGKIQFAWSGTSAAVIGVATDGFDWEGDDLGHLDIPATSFTSVSDTVELRRENRTLLRGGAVGSDLSAEYKTKTDFIVINPFP